MSFNVVILSAQAANLVPCVRSVLANGPDLSPEQIVVVDDGARAEAEPQLPPVRWVPGVRPFIYARNAQPGHQCGRHGCDPAQRRRAVDHAPWLHAARAAIRGRPQPGVYSAGIRGVVGNRRQIASQQRQLRLEPTMLAFVCVYIPRSAIDQIGLLDERFTGYGCEDNDYCARARVAGARAGHLGWLCRGSFRRAGVDIPDPPRRADVTPAQSAAVPGKVAPAAPERCGPRRSAVPGLEWAGIHPGDFYGVARQHRLALRQPAVRLR